MSSKELTCWKHDTQHSNVQSKMIIDQLYPYQWINSFVPLGIILCPWLLSISLPLSLSGLGDSEHLVPGR